MTVIGFLWDCMAAAAVILIVAVLVAAYYTDPRKGFW